MPFTPAHALAVLPIARLARGRLPLSALVVGSMAPDLEYLLALDPTARVGHTFVGLLVFCLPVGLVTLWTWHRLAKVAALRAMPDVVRARAGGLVGRFAFGPWRRSLAIGASILVGACTHLAWDACTHKRGVIVQHLDWLQWNAFTIGRQEVPLYHLLQHGSSVLGLAGITVLIARALLRDDPTQPHGAVLSSPVPPPPSLPSGWRAGFAALVIALSLGFAALAVSRREHPLATVNALRGTVVALVVCGMSGTWAALIAWGLAARIALGLREADES